MNRTRAPWIALVAILATRGAILAEEKAAGSDDSAAIPVADIKHAGPVDFAGEILPLLTRSCLACHNKTDQKGDLVLETPESIREGGKSGPAALPAKGAESLLVLSASHASKPFMPPKNNKASAPALSSQELGLLKLWVDQGATGSAKQAVKKTEWRPLARSVNPIYAAALSFDGRIAACGRGNQLYVYNFASGQGPLHLGVNEIAGAADLDGVQSLAIEPTGSLLASGGYRTVRLWRRPRAPRGLNLADLGAAVTTLAASFDGARAAVGLADGRIVLWTMADGKTSRPIAAHASAVTGLELSADGARLFSGSQDGSIGVWSSADGFPEARFAAQAPVNAIALANKGTQLAAAGTDNAIRVWTLAPTGVAAAAPATLAGHQKPVTSLAVVPSSDTQIISGSEDGTVRFWDLATAKEIRQASHGAPVASVAVRPDGQAFASAGADKRTVLWNAADLKVIAELKGDPEARTLADVRKRETDYATGIANGKKGSLAAAQKKVEEEEKKVADAKTAFDKLVVDQTAAQAVLASKSPTDKQKAEAEMAAAKKKAEETMTNAASAVKSAQDEVTRQKAQADEAEGAQKSAQAAFEASQKAAAESESPFRSVAFSADSAQLATAADDGVLRLWSGKNGAPVETLRGHSGAVTAVEFVKGKGFVSGAADKSAGFWDLGAAWSLERTIGSSEDASLFTDRVTALGFSPDGTLLVTGGGEPSRSGELKIWKVADGSLVLNVPNAHSDVINSVEVSPDGKLIASGAADKFVKVFEVATGKLVKAFEGHTHHVLGVSWRSDSKVIASSGADSVVKVWSLESGEQMRTIEGFGKQVTSVHFVPYTSNIVTSSGDRNVRLHNTENGQAIRSFGATDYLYASGVTPDGRMVIGAGFASILHAWDAANGEVRAAIGP